MKKLAGFALLIAILFATAPFAQAVYTYGTNVQGTSVIYETITADDPEPGSTLPLWGTMSISGNALRFKPTDFEAEAQDGASDTVDGTLQFTLKSKPGQAENRYITSINFIEYGHYSLLDNTLTGFDGTNATNAAVTCGLFIDIEEIDGQFYFGPTIEASLTYTPSSGDYFLDADGETLLSSWQGGLNLDLADYGFTNVTKLSVSINNILNVASEDGTYALIEKKGVGENPAIEIVPVIPEPATMVLLGLGGLLLRRK